MKIIYPILFFATITVVSCKKDASEIVNPSNEFKKVVRLYCSDNPEIAEQALLNHRKCLLTWMDEGVKLDYDHTLGINDARLYDFYRMHGNSKSQEYYQMCTNYLTKARLARGAPPKIYSEDDIIQIVAAADTNLLVGWKTTGIKTNF